MDEGVGDGGDGVVILLVVGGKSSSSSSSSSADARGREKEEVDGAGERGMGGDWEGLGGDCEVF